MTKPRINIGAILEDDSWERWRGRIEEKVDAIPQAIGGLRKDFQSVVAGDVECKVGQRLRRVEGRVWKTMLLAFAMPLVVALIVGLVVHYR